MYYPNFFISINEVSDGSLVRSIYEYQSSTSTIMKDREVIGISMDVSQ